MVQHFPAPSIEQISHSLRCIRLSIVLQNDGWVLQKVSPLSFFFLSFFLSFFFASFSKLVAGCVPKTQPATSFEKVVPSGYEQRRIVAISAFPSNHAEPNVMQIFLMPRRSFRM
jgi:hypothetical protein